MAETFPTPSGGEYPQWEALAANAVNARIRVFSLLMDIRRRRSIHETRQNSLRTFPGRLGSYILHRACAGMAEARRDFYETYPPTTEAAQLQRGVDDLLQVAAIDHTMNYCTNRMCDRCTQA